MTEKEDPRGFSKLDELRVDPSALEGDPFARKATFLSSLRASGRGWVAALIAIGVLVLAYRFSAPLSSQVADPPPNPPAAAVGTAPGTASASGPVRLQAADPAALKMQIVADLRAVGVEAIGYDRLGLSGVDAQLPEPLTPPVRQALEKHGIPVPAEGVIRVEIAQSR